MYTRGALQAIAGKNVKTALLQCQVIKLLHWVKDEQTCSSNNKARCIPAELCKLSRVKIVEFQLTFRLNPELHCTALQLVKSFRVSETNFLSGYFLLPNRKYPDIILSVGTFPITQQEIS
jgi:hypothetical protein